ncbi:MAG: RNA polymerase sigma factor [Planctomycetota bacterium]|jgi:RNA polymerase sigma-70 factor (ECF subfamily)
MSHADSTHWSVIRGAAHGEEADRREFIRRYEDVARAYLGARWCYSVLAQEIDDATQEVFLRCFKPDGIVARVDPERPGGFRAYFFGAVRNVALEYERQRARRKVEHTFDHTTMDRIVADEEGPSTAFDHAWARAILKEAVAHQAQRALEVGAAARRRVELLHLRFDEGLPIREIARLWGDDPSRLHYEYAKARKEFKAALLEVVSFHHPGGPAELERECARLLQIVG